jgi:hypothetical protein
MIKFLNIIVIVCLTIFIISCTKVQHPTDPKKLVIIGNSIVRHSPRPEVGWYGDWGMAASVADSDFVHRIINSIKRNNLNYSTTFLNIANFETRFYDYDFNILDTLKNTEIVIIKIGENVVEKTAIDSNFIAYYDRLVNYFKNSSNTIVLSDGFYNLNKKGQEDSTINFMIKDYANKNNLIFVQTNDLSKDSSNRAYKTYSNKGVQAHPSDKGMRLIHDRIWEKIKNLL